MEILSCMAMSVFRTSGSLLDVQTETLAVRLQFPVQRLDVLPDHVGRVKALAIAVRLVALQIVAHGLLRLRREGHTALLVETVDRGHRISDEILVADVMDA